MPNLTGTFSIDLTVLDVPRSSLWYAELLEMETRREYRSDDGQLVHVVLSHSSGLTIGLIQHEVQGSSVFDERNVGLDHLEFIVPEVEDVYKWANRLDELGVAHSGVMEFEHTTGVMVTFRDPDNIQLEFYSFKSEKQS
jgi:glyoxylase I family protein